MKDVIKKVILSSIPRILGMGNRKLNEKTYGCFDRNYWHYQIKDMPNARFQEVSFLLSLLYRNGFEDNIYAHDKNILNWIIASIDYWKKIRNRDGSLNEVYPFERSFCATSFSTFCVTESMLLSGIEPDKSLLRTARWLLKNNNKEVANQVAASTLALYNLFSMFGDSEIHNAYQKKLNQLLKSVEKYGYFPEYGGFDLGYNTVTLSLLSYLCEKNKDVNIKSVLERVVAKIEPELDRYGNYDFNKMSRQTQFVYPYGLAFYGSAYLENIKQGILENKIITPLWLDDRYVVQLTTDYLLTYLFLERHKANLQST